MGIKKTKLRIIPDDNDGNTFDITFRNSVKLEVS